ncbi:MAG: phosphoenolpyruvate synthase [Candidatus Parcubacteria bacterium]|nr:MAG: phosphoenolpyruvate synthase [Candidatus Parcubacteria bacterium]
MKEEKYILWFKEISKEDVIVVGGKNANLGEMYQKLSNLGVKVPNGFAITTKSYDYFIKYNNLEEKIKEILKNLDVYNVEKLQKEGEIIRNLIKQGEFPEDLKKEILDAFEKLKEEYGEDLQVAVRSSASAEDLPDASFAGQQETYLNVIQKDLLEKIKYCFASLFTDRAIFYRQEKGFDHFQVKLSVGVQKMIRSDLASSGVMFTIDTDSGLNKVIVINGVWGLGELIVQGKVIPDEWIVFKESLEKGFRSIISKRLGEKVKKIVYAEEGGVKEIETKEEEKVNYSLNNDEVLELAKMGLIIEKHYGRPMDIEWAKDGIDGKLYIVQARAETVHSTKKYNVYEEYILASNQSDFDLRQSMVLKGIAIGSKITSGKIRVIKDVSKINEFQEGEILVTEMTDPDWVPIMKIAKGIITDKGGRTCHAAIVSRELGIPAIVGTQKATEVLKTGDEVTIDCSTGITGYVYKGKIGYEVIEHNLENLPETKTKIYVNIGLPDEAWEKWYLPVKGVGLAREEFIIAEEIKIHPNALIDYPNLSEEIKEKIDELTRGYEDKKQYFIDKLAEGIAKICVAYWPHEVIVRFSDFKTNEYRNLIGGDFYEPEEENPMIGWRGASRYYHPKFKKSFELEVSAMKKVREEMGISNLVMMVPFCRTPEEGRKVIEIIENILGPRKEKNYKVYVMAEIPSNILQADEFLEIFDGMSIGSNDLTQLILGIDRDNEMLQGLADERNESVKKLISEVIRKCKEKGKYVGICGQAPSDFPEIVELLVKEGIESLSVNSDVVVKTIEMVKKFEDENK